MPTNGGTKKRSRKTSGTKKSSETRELIEAVNALREQMQKNQPTKGWRRFFENLGKGIVTGVGIVIGSTVIAAVILIGIQRIVTSPAFQDQLNETLQTIIQQSISSALEG